MKRVRLPIFASLAILSIAACSGKKPVDDAANEVVSTPLPASNANGDAGVVAGGPPTDNLSSAVPGPVPASLQGKWGLTPADCQPGRSDAKGLLVVGPDTLTFYESRAVPGASVERGDATISGEWNFTGEGQRWTKYVSLKLDGNGLVRTERNPAASYKYAKCN